jgi:5-methylcytosine-specific restriction endonuclease McrA
MTHFFKLANGSRMPAPVVAVQRFRPQIETMSRYISDSVRHEVFQACEGHCFYCQKQIVEKNRSGDTRGTWEPDHLIHFSNGGANDARNLVAGKVFGCITHRRIL